MASTMDLPRVINCTVEGCAYNHEDACAAAAVTIGSKEKASCVTFIPLGVKGGLDRVTSFVGACQKADCVHNDHLECGAESVRVGFGTADCLTYATA